MSVESLNEGRCALRRFLLIVLAVCSFSIADAATFRYSYQGQDFVTSGGSIGQPPLGPAGLTAISGYLEFGAALTPSLDFASVTGVSSYAFFDGVSVYDDTNSSVATLEVSTDASGNLTAWLLTLPQNVPGTDDYEPISMTISSFNRQDASTPTFDSVRYSGGVAIIGTEIVPVVLNVRSASAGQWSASVVPIPATVWLFGSALGFLGWRSRR